MECRAGACTRGSPATRRVAWQTSPIARTDPRPAPHQIAPAIEAQICELRRIHPDWVPAPSPITSSGWESSRSRRVLIRTHLLEPRRRRKRKTDYRRFERSKAMELWQADIMGGAFLASGQELKLITGVDDHSASA